MIIAQANCKELPLASNSVDLIFTDPPYWSKFIHVYGWLASEAERVLRPGGFLMAIVPGFRLPETITMLTAHLDWFWALNIRHAGMGSMMWQKRVIVREKVLATVSKGKSKPRCNVVSGIEGGGSDKRYHEWGQDVASARYFIDCFSRPGDLVCDPFLGGGTTAVACELTERRFVGFDIDPEACVISRERLNVLKIPRVLPLFLGMTL